MCLGIVAIVIESFVVSAATADNSQVRSVWGVLQFITGFGVFAIGRNHPTVKRALADVLAGDLADLVQMDVSPLAGMLAEQLIAAQRDKR